MNVILTDEIFKAHGFVHKWPEYINNPEWRRGDDHPDGRGYVIDMGGGYKGVMLGEPDMWLRTEQDLINYLNNPNRHKG